jgi:hypothetical protein
MNSIAGEPPYLLAAQAGSMVRLLYGRVRGDGLESPADLGRTLAALRQLSDDLTNLLPCLQDRLEECLMAGEVGAAGSTVDAWDSVAEVGRVLMQARTAGQLMALELRSSEKLLGELAAS